MRKICRDVLGKRVSHRALDELSFNLLSLLSNWRSAHLVDTCTVSAAQAKDLVEQAFESREQEFVAISLSSGDVVLANRERLLRGLNSERHVVNVSLQPDCPRLEERPTVNAMCLKLHGMLDASKDTVIHVDVHKEAWNLTTLFGAVLDYPVVYWFEGERHCLDGADLTVCTVRHKRHHKFVLEQFTYPQSLSDQLEEAVKEKCFAKYPETEFEVSFSVANHPSLAL